MGGFCAAPSLGDGLVRGLLGSVDCNVQVMSQLGYQAVSGPNSEFSFMLTALMTIFVAIYGIRLLMGFAPLRVGEIAVMAMKLGLVLALVTSWPTYQQLVFQTLFRGPEEIAASLMRAIQPPGSALAGNPFDGLQVTYDALQAAAAFFARISLPSASPLMGGVPFAALSLNAASVALLFTTLGMMLAAKVVLGLLLALGPLFIAFLLFDNTRGLFEGWLRAAIAFSLVPLFATFALTLELIFVAPHLTSLSQMISSGEPNVPEATAAFVLTMIAAMISVAGVFGIFIVATGFKFQWGRGDRASMAGATSSGTTQTFTPTASSARAEPLQPRVASVAAAVSALDRRDSRTDGMEAPRRLSLGVHGGADTASAPSRGNSEKTYRRSAQPRHAASSARRDR